MDKPATVSNLRDYPMPEIGELERILGFKQEKANQSAEDQSKQTNMLTAVNRLSSALERLGR